MEVKINNTLQARLYANQLDNNKIPSKLSKEGKQFVCRVFSITGKLIDLTKRAEFMNKDSSVFLDEKEIKVGDKAYGLIVFKKENTCTIKFFNHISAILDSKHAKAGEVIKVYVSKLRKGKQRMEVTTKKPEGVTADEDM